MATINVGGLITGATYIKNYNIIVLSGYNSTLSPFIYLIYDLNGLNFNQANQRKIDLNLSFHQIDSISSIDGLEYFLMYQTEFVIKLIFEQIVVKHDYQLER